MRRSAAQCTVLIRYANVALRHLELCTLPSRDVSAPVKKNKTKTHECLGEQSSCGGLNDYFQDKMSYRQASFLKLNKYKNQSNEPVF